MALCPYILLFVPDSVYLYMCCVDKSAQMNEFISHIKMNPELATMFESVQRDTTMTSETSLMDIS